MKIKKQALALATSLLMLNAAYAVPSFTNSSFETGNTVGWTELSSFGGIQPWLGLTGVLPAMDGRFAYWFGATDNRGATHLGQTLSGFTVGQTYTVSFGMVPEQGSNRGRPGAFVLLDLVGADVTSQRFSALASDPNCSAFFSCAPGWQDKSLTFTALDSIIKFDWHADVVTSSSWEFGFDNVRLTQSTVPEPSSTALLALALGGLVGLRRWKK